MTAALPDGSVTTLPAAFVRATHATRRFVARNWKVGVYVLLILLCALFAPEDPLKFIYTEF